ncbi:hypothetical protein J4Q44_G00109980 [Coregonus suidteri]|uniref:Uncharacterized protein n=1 Tax=Coregonus suidteri TaxID=861788 RepID=A0AAN8R8M9_9TELE
MLPAPGTLQLGSTLQPAALPAPDLAPDLGNSSLLGPGGPGVSRPSTLNPGAWNWLQVSYLPNLTPLLFGLLSVGGIFGSPSPLCMLQNTGFTIERGVGVHLDTRSG